MQHTLVLNADGNPLSIIPLSAIPWQSAVKLYLLNKVNVLDTYDEIIHSQQLSLPKPSVIITREYYKNRYVPEFSRINLLYRDDFTCQYCSHTFAPRDLTMDHVIPRSQGGGKSFKNIVMSCRRCNEDKADKYKKPIKIPSAPTYYELANKRKKYPVVISHPSWQKYLGWDDNLVKIGRIHDHYNPPFGENFD